jgi:hypothetical protein
VPPPSQETLSAATLALIASVADGFFPLVLETSPAPAPPSPALDKASVVELPVTTPPGELCSPLGPEEWTLVARSKKRVGKSAHAKPAAARPHDTSRGGGSQRRDRTRTS